MGKESIREALIEELWPLVKTNGLGARERTGLVLDELERRGLFKLWRWRCDRCLQIVHHGIGHGPGLCIDRRDIIDEDASKYTIPPGDLDLR